MQVIDLSMKTAAPSVAAEPARDSAASESFSRVMSEVVVQSGDTLVGLVRAHHRQQGLAVSESQAYRLALRVAERNQISNPNQITPGQKVDFSDLQLPPLDDARLSVIARAPGARGNLQDRATTAVSTSQVINERISDRSQLIGDGSAQLLDKTLQRAADKGFVPADQLPAAKDRILAMANRYGFDPDDFARLTLMESGGMNPMASNGRCHGIIQFCDGPQRGAAAVGMAQQPRAILGMGLLQQLDLVDRYFQHNGLDQRADRSSKLSLDDLYLTVLHPAAKAEPRKDVPLNIPGPQAAWLHVGQDPRAPITRASLVAGLRDHAESALVSDNVPSTNRASRVAARAYAQSAVAFADLEPLSTRMSSWTPAVLNSGRFSRTGS